MSNLGKLPPQAIDCEEALLGTLMIAKGSINTVMDIIKPASFYTDAHQKVYTALLNLASRSLPTDTISVTQELRSMGQLEQIGGAFFLIELTDKSSSAYSLEHYARIIEQKYMQRELISQCNQAIHNAYEDTTDIFDLIEGHQASIFGLVASKYSRDYTRIDAVIAGQLAAYEKVPQHGLTGVGTGFKSIDRITNGWQPSDLVIIAARPAMGKTAFVIQTAKLAAIQYQVPVGIFSLEMSKEQLTDRLISSETGVYQDKIQRRDLSDYDWHQLHHNIGSLYEAPIFIDDTPGMKITEFKVKARRLKEKHQVGMIIVDYLQLMKGSRDSSGKANREQEISEISRELKITAKELGVPVLALSQLSRRVEERPGDKRPMLSDLRESGSIEQDADKVIFLYRPEYYGYQEDGAGNSTAGVCEAIFAKNRSGACDTALLNFNGGLMKFLDLEDLHRP